MAGYHSPQVSVEVRLNTNESPYPPPDSWRADFNGALSNVVFNRYPDRSALELRTELANLHGVSPEEIFCANGSNEVLQCILLAYGGAGRTAVVFEPTYALHSHIARLTATQVVEGKRNEEFAIEPSEVDRVFSLCEPSVTFLCSPNNPTGGADSRELISYVIKSAPGLVVVDEAYGQFAPFSALQLRSGNASEAAPAPTSGLVVVRTFSKTWSLAGARLGYLVADRQVVRACEAVALPYHLSVPVQLAGKIALKYRKDMEQRVLAIRQERDRVSAAMTAIGVQVWHSDSNFVLFRIKSAGTDADAGAGAGAGAKAGFDAGAKADAVWQALVDRSVLIRNCSSWKGLEGCLRVTIGTPEDNDRFLEALEASLK